MAMNYQSILGLKSLIKIMLITTSARYAIHMLLRLNSAFILYIGLNPLK